jgi:hypothetical protein
MDTKIRIRLNGDKKQIRVVHRERGKIVGDSGWTDHTGKGSVQAAAAKAEPKPDKPS